MPDIFKPAAVHQSGINARPTHERPSENMDGVFSDGLSPPTAPSAIIAPVFFQPAKGRPLWCNKTQTISAGSTWK
ncbi:hypothetical protein [Neisseria bacilliformis]|uniref:hypothetical protein n=1 Tax=Neisseria bacilliformis TaxID=267212 RepID=UPI001364927E|nr:hypothetical protein [Neisseria bacilliformis]